MLAGKTPDPKNEARAEPRAWPTRRPAPDASFDLSVDAAVPTPRDWVYRSTPDSPFRAPFEDHEMAAGGAEQAIRTLFAFQPSATTVERWQSRSDSTILPHSDARLHSDEYAAMVAEAHNADAVTIGEDIYLGAEPTPALLSHELAHVEQARLPGPAAPRHAREDEAERAQASPHADVSLPGPANEPMAHPAVRILLRAGKWLAKRTVATISKHVARHGRRIAGRAIHSIFRNPRKIKRLVSRAVKDGLRLARRATQHGADEVLEEGGVRIFRQATRTPGKFRTVVEKDFGRAIGTRGETIIRVIIDQSGRIVTAFPVDRFLTIGAAAATIFGAHSAEAAGRIQSAVEAHETAKEEAETDWIGEVLDFINPLSSGESLNEDEDLYIAIDRIIEETYAKIIEEIQEQDEITLTDEELEAIRELLFAAIATPMVLDEVEEETGN